MFEMPGKKEKKNLIFEIEIFTFIEMYCWRKFLSRWKFDFM